MDELEARARLLEIPKLVDIEHRLIAEISEKIERLECERKSRLAAVLDLQAEELRLLRGGAA